MTKKTIDVFPMFPENKCAIACSSSAEYAPYLSVFLQSIKENASAKNTYDIIVFESSWTDALRKKITDFFNSDNFSVRFVNPMDIIQQYNLKFPAHYALECYVRLCSPIILKNFDKLIFTDVDLVFQKDPALLYETDLTGYPLAACQDLVYGAMLNTDEKLRNYEKEFLMLEKPYEYFNTGVMVLNVKEFLKNDYSGELLELVSKITFKILEQDGLNRYFQNNIKYIDTAWNYAVPIKRYLKILENMPKNSKVIYEKDRQNPGIIHWAGAGKPWNDPGEDLADVWWGYARKTPFYEECLLQTFGNKLEQLRGEFVKIHFPNINNRFANLEDTLSVSFVANNIVSAKIKKCLYRFKKHCSLTKNTRKKYAEKYGNLKKLLKSAKKFKKSIL